MESKDARLVQYRVLADHRLHFGRLYFQVIGLNVALTTGASTAIAINQPTLWPAASLLAGLVLLGTAFVAHRLHSQEEICASALRAIEHEELKMIQVAGPERHGARRLVVLGLALAGLMLVAMGIGTSGHSCGL